MITLQKPQLRAAIECAATKDIRCYLNGVLVECAANGDVHIVGTDGNVLFAGLIAAPNAKWSDGSKIGMNIIIPRDVIKRECKGVGGVDLIALPDGKYQLGQTVFAAVYGVFPDWRRVVPSAEAVRQNPPAFGQFHPDLLKRANDALRAWFGWKLGAVGYLHHCGPRDAAVMVGDDCTACVVAIPLRHDGGNVEHFTPAAKA